MPKKAVVPPVAPKRSSLEQRVVNIITTQWGVDDEEVTPDASFVKDLSADSLDRIEIVMAIEADFGISIDDDDAEGIDTLPALIALLVQKKGVKP